MSQYENTQLDLIDELTLVRLTGLPLDGGGREWKGWFPVRPCLCATAEDCPCDVLDDIVVWLPVGTRSKLAGKEIEAGALHEFSVANDAQLIVEARVPMTLDQLLGVKTVSENAPTATGSQQKVTLDSSIGRELRDAITTGLRAEGIHIGTTASELCTRVHSEASNCSCGTKCGSASLIPEIMYFDDSPHYPSPTGGWRCAPGASYECGTKPGGGTALCCDKWVPDTTIGRPPTHVTPR